MKHRLLVLLLLLVAGHPGLAEEPKKGIKLPGSVVALYNGINELRASNGLQPVKFSGKLVLAAMDHSKEMVQLDYFSHNSPTPGRSSCWDRVEAQGYDWAEVCENIFRSGRTGDEEIARDALDAWNDSSNHRDNMLDPTVKDIGIGVAKYPNGDTVVTLVMGREF